jgi:UDP-2,3-diacylglucosamine pyrophosphatase LpxH
MRVYIMADLHLGARLHDKQRRKQFIEEILEEENRYLIVNGDIINNAIKHSKSDIYSEDLSPDEALEKTVEVLEPVRERILVIIDGNHEDRTYRQAGLSIMKIVAQRLGLDDLYAEPAYKLFLSFGKNQGRDNRKTCYSVYGKHGNGGARTIGGKLNYVDRMAHTTDADIYIHSHTHLPGAFRKAYYLSDYRNKKSTKKDRVFVNANAFLLFGDYGEKKGYPPASTVYPYLVLKGEERFTRAVV